MSEIDLEILDTMIEKGRELKRLLKETPEVIEYLRLINIGEEKSILPPKSDVLVRAGEAARVLGVNKETIYRYVEEKLLTPLYTPHSNQMKFWLSEVKGIVTKAG